MIRASCVDRSDRDRGADRARQAQWLTRARCVARRATPSPRSHARLYARAQEHVDCAPQAHVVRTTDGKASSTGLAPSPSEVCASDTAAPSDSTSAKATPPEPKP